MQAGYPNREIYAIGGQDESMQCSPTKFPQLPFAPQIVAMSPERPQIVSIQTLQPRQEDTSPNPGRPNIRSHSIMCQPSWVNQTRNTT